MTNEADGTNSGRRRLAIIGCGSSGLITLKTAIDTLSDWDIVCYEQSDSITGCWGNPYPGFVSTSTRYTTQFSCYPVVGATVSEDGGESREEFFKEDEYGKYLEAFADRFKLRPHIFLNHHVENVKRNASGQWEMLVVEENEKVERFDSVVICTGLAAKPKPVSCDIQQISAADINRPGGLERIEKKTIVVIGGGESAVDYANRLARSDLNNTVYLSLHSGVRVSPRYHPVRGVPSDFLRNRLMLSVDPDIRNWLGQIFVEWRIKYQRKFEKLFPSKTSSRYVGDTESDNGDHATQLRRRWTLELTMAAKDDLFNMFHNKSDDFLQTVGEGRIKIVGAPVDESYSSFYSFGTQGDGAESHRVNTDLIFPAIGYQSTLSQLTESNESLTGFYLGCCHADRSNLFVVGFARPIIGNIPSISEMQANYVCRVIAGDCFLPANVKEIHETDLNDKRTRFEKLNLESVYPVEMFPYCDQLARLMGLPIGSGMPLGLKWWKTMLSPASTMHYFGKDQTAQDTSASAPIYMPTLLILFVLLMKPVDWIYRCWKWVARR